VNVRDKPSLKESNVITTRQKEFIFSSQGVKSTDNAFVQVQIESKNLWVSLSVVESTPCVSSPSPSPSPSSSSSCFVAVTSPVVLRDAPARSGNKAGWLIEGQIVRDLKQKSSDGEWLKLAFGALEAWTFHKNVRAIDCKLAVDKPSSGVTGEFGLNLIKSMEGFRADYYDDKGHPAIGYGFNCGFQDCSKLKPPISEQFALELLKQTNKQFESCVAKRFKGIPMTQKRFDILVSFVYNTGCNALDNPHASTKIKPEDRKPGKITSLTLLVKAQNWNAVAKEFCRYIYAQNKIEEALVLRRSAEASALIDSAIVCPNI
jgi:GH24 family phage-related lysozyme (muramidase)